MGDAYKNFERTLNSYENNKVSMNLIEQLFGYVIQYGSPFLNKYLNLTASKPYIGLTNTFYYYASKIGEDFKTSIENLQAYYNEIYKRNGFYARFKFWVLQLEEVGILTAEKTDIVKGNSLIFNKINSAIRMNSNSD